MPRDDRNAYGATAHRLVKRDDSVGRVRYATLNLRIRRDDRALVDRSSLFVTTSNERYTEASPMQDTVW